MSGQLSLFNLELDTPVVSEPAPEVVIALEETEKPVIADVISPEAENDGQVISPVIAPETVITEVSEELGVPEGDIVALVGLSPEEQPTVSADTLSSEPEAGIAPVIADDQPVEETAPAPEMTLDELDEHIANDTVSFLPRPADLEEEEKEPAIVLPGAVPVIPPEKQFELILKAHWANSMDLAYCMLNIALPADDDYLFDDFTDYIKACRLADTGARERPKADERFDRLAWCLHQMEFSKIKHDGKGKLVRAETNVLDLAVDLSFDLDELGELREFGVRGASGERVSQLAWAIKTYVERNNDEVRIPTGTPEATQIVQNIQNMLDEVKQSTYSILFDRLGVPKDKFPDFSNMDAVLSALLDAIGTNENKLDLVLSYSDITEKQLFKAAEKDIETQKRLWSIARAQLKRDLAGFHGTNEWYQHRCFAPLPVLLTDGVKYLCDHGGQNATTAYWLMDAIASYQGETKVKRQEYQKWKLVVRADENGRQSAVLTCGWDDEKPIVRQDIEWTNFLLDEITVYAGRNPIDESGKLCLIICLPGED